MTGDFSKLPRDLRNVLTSELAPGERVLYAAQPDWRAQWAQHLLVFTFGLGWMSICGPMAIFVWAETLGLRVPSVGAMGKGLAIFFSLLIIPFVVIGLACLVEPFSSARQSRRRVHAITDQRVMTITHVTSKTLESCKLDAINFVKRRDRKDGSGTLSIGYGVEKDSDGDARPLTMDWPGIPNAKRAEQIIREQAKWVR